MNDDEVHDSLLNPEARKTIKITREGAEYAVRLISTKEARKALMKEIGCLSGTFDYGDFLEFIESKQEKK